jgi:type VI secretion system Hcp family effector
VEGNFQVLSTSFRASLSGLGTASTKFSLGDLTLTKEFDACSVPLFTKSMQAEKLTSVRITNYVVVNKGQLFQPALDMKMRIELENAYIRTYQITTVERDDSGPVLVESVTFAYEKISLRHFNPNYTAGYDAGPL